MKRFLLVPLVGVIAALGLGSAAALGNLDRPNLAAASANVESCDPTGVGVAYTTTWDSGFVVTHVVITEIDNACDGDRLSVVLSDGAAQISAGYVDIVVDAADTDETIAIGPWVPVENVTGVHVLIDDN